MKNSAIIVLTLIVVLIVGWFVFSNSGNLDSNNQNPSQVQGQVQKVIISQKNYNYYPREIHVKANQPVEISLDSSVSGCLRSFTVKDFGVAKYLPKTSDTVTFTPDRKGTFTFACAMGMGYGKLVVE